MPGAPRAGPGIGAYLGASTCSQALLAADAARPAALAWALARALFVSTYQLADGDAVMRIATAVVAAAALALLAAAVILAARRSGKD